MRFLSLNYNYSPGFNTPQSWFARTSCYTGMLEVLAENHTVIAIKHIDFEGICHHNDVEHHFVDFGKKQTYFPFLVNRLVRHLKPDVIILHGTA